MRWLCAFLQCKWYFIGNVMSGRTTRYGLYQCTNCKSLSTGSER
jgi:hypothetical protein